MGGISHCFPHIHRIWSQWSQRSRLVPELCHGAIVALGRQVGMELLGRGVISVPGQNLHPSQRHSGHHHVGAEGVPQPVEATADSRTLGIRGEPVGMHVVVRDNSRWGRRRSARARLVGNTSRHLPDSANTVDSSACRALIWPQNTAIFIAALAEVCCSLLLFLRQVPIWLVHLEVLPSDR